MKIFKPETAEERTQQLNVISLAQHDADLLYPKSVQRATEAQSLLGQVDADKSQFPVPQYGYYKGCSVKIKQADSRFRALARALLR